MTLSIEVEARKALQPRVAGKFPAESGGQRRRFWRLSSLDAKAPTPVLVDVGRHLT